jgi:hypothetical protein
MGNIIQASELSGRKYSFTIAGDEPTTDEQQQIDSIIRQNDAQFIEEYKSQYGVSPTDEGSGFSNQVGEFFKGIGRGGVGLAETSALGTAALLPLDDNTEMSAREFIRSLSYGVQRNIQPDIGLEDSRAGKFGETLGSVAGTYAPAFIPGIGIPLAFGTAVTAGAGEASERAIAAGATEEERDLSTLQGAGVGATELIPLGGPIMRRIRNTGGLNRIKRALAQGGIEGAQETAANVLQNLIEQGYNLEQELGEGNLEAAGYGGAAGGTVQFLVDLVRPRRARSTVSFDETIGGSTASASGQDRDSDLEQNQGAADATNTTTDDDDSTGTGTGDGDSQPSVVGSEGDGRGVESTEDVVSSDDGSVGGGVLSTDGATDTTGVQPNTLVDDIKTKAKVQSVEEEAKEEEATDEDESVDMSGLVRKKDDAELDDTTEEATDKSETKGVPAPAAAGGVRNKNKFSEITTDTLLAQATTISGPQGTRFIDPNDPAGLQNDLIMQQAERDVLVGKFAGWKQKNPELGVFHDELVGDREASSPENYLSTKDLAKLNSLSRKYERRDDPDEVALTPEEQAAFTFFERFERPETALDEIASRTQIRIGDTAPASVKGTLGGMEITKQSGQGQAARAAAFAEPFDQNTAKLAEKWVTDNLAPETTKRYNEQKADVLERLNPKSRKQYKIKTKLQDVEPRPVGRDPESVAAQAEWDAQFADAYTRDGKPKPTQAEAMEAKVKKDEAEAKETLNDQLDREQAEQERQERLATGVSLPPEVEGLGTDVVDLDAESSLSKLDRTEFLTKEEERALNFKTANRANDEKALRAMEKLEFRRNSMRAKIREDKNLLASLYGEGLTYEDLTQDRDGSLGLPDLFNKKDALFTRFVTDRNRPLDPTVMTMLEDNNLADALREYAAGANPASRMFAKTFAKYAGNTQVRFEDKGEQIAGFFAPRTNTITFNTNVPTTEHTFLHEVGHAVMSSYIANNPQSAPVLTLRKIYNDVKEAFPSAYNFDEFIAEVPSNQQMRTTLSELLDPNRYGTAYQRVIEAIRRIFQRIGFELGGKPPVQKSLLEIIDPLVYKLMEPAPTSRDAAPMFQLAHNPAAVDRLFRDATTNSPVFNEEAYNKFDELTKQTPKDWSQDKLGTVKGWVLKATPLHYVTRMAEKFAPSAASINNLVNQSGGELQSGYDKVNQVNDGIVKWANKSSKKNIAAWNRLNNIGTSYQVNPALSEREARDKYSPDMYKVYELIRKDYKRLQRVDRGEPIRLYHQSQNMFKSLVEDLITAIDTRLEASGVPEQSRTAIRDTFYTNLIKKGKLEPYTPLQRDGGDYWLSLNAIDPVTGRIERYSDSFQGEQARDRAREAIVADAKQNILNAPEGSPARIALESRTEGMSQMSQEDALNDMLDVESTQELDATSFMRRAPNASFVNELMSKLEGSGELTAETKDEIANVILKTLPETSYLQSFRMRKGGDLIKARMGYNEDSMKAIADRSRSLIRQSVNIKYKAKMQQALSKVEKEMNESGGNRIDKNELLNSLRNTVSDGPIPERSKVSRALTGVGFNMTLGMNVSGGLVNLTQIPLVTLPYLGGKYGYATTMGSIKGAMSLMKNSGGTRTIMGYGTDANNQPIETEVGSGYSISNVNPRNLTNTQRRILNKMSITPEELQVFIDTGTDLGQFKRSLDHEILDVDRMGGFWSKFNKFSGFIQHHSERVNREAALFAAYRGALSKLSPQQRANPDVLLKAAQDAVYDTETTNGGIAAAAAPELGRRNLGAVIFMYKRYGVSMIGMLTEMVMKITKGSPADRRLALYQLAGIYGTSGMLAGVYGMPGFGLATTVIDTVMAAMGMDPGGEDDDAKTMARAYLHEGVYKGGVNYFTGVNIASRVGLSELIYRDSMMDRDWPLLFRMAEQLGGPVIGIALNTERGLNQILEGAADGDTEKLKRGIETISPAAIKNMQKAARFARDGGAYTMDGKPIVPDIADGHLLAQFFGFSPAAYSAQMATNSQTMRQQKAILRKRRQIYNMYARAYFDGDVEGLQRAAQKMIEYNQRYPQYPILQDNLDKSIRGRIRQRTGAYNGLTLNPRLRNMLVEQAERYGDPTIFD